jgi:molybdopterin biosynthesis enzyme
MISVDEAIRIILNNTQLNETEDVHYLDALNKITSTSVYAKDPLPPFAASVKDGFAIKLTEKQLDKLNKKINDNISFVFDVIGSSNAGDDIINIDLKGGECVKINTGAPVPLKADAVVQIEDTVSLNKDENGHDTKIIVVETNSCGGDLTKEINIKLGQDIRPIGFDIKVGEEVVKEFTLIKPAQIG